MSITVDAVRLRLRDRDGSKAPRHWILEIDLVSPDRSFRGFYERLLEG
ncbi:hypothetical protein [Novosphingobium guangzhouense]|nr:hypothetical protein [Novosphingobium guangzhouense]